MFGDLLQKLLRIPGASYCCIADGARGTVVEDAGATDGAVHLAVLGRGTAAAGYLAGAHDELAEIDELIVTTRRAYHLVRELDGSSEPLLVYLRLDRPRADLAAGRRALAAAGAPPRARRLLTALRPHRWSFREMRRTAQRECVARGRRKSR